MNIPRMDPRPAFRAVRWKSYASGVHLLMWFEQFLDGDGESLPYEDRFVAPIMTCWPSLMDLFEP